MQLRRRATGLCFHAKCLMLRRSGPHGSWPPFLCCLERTQLGGKYLGEQYPHFILGDMAGQVPTTLLHTVPYV